MYVISIIWCRHLAVYLFDLNCKSDIYNQFIEKNTIISMYNSSFFINARKTSIVIPFFLGVIICCLLLKYFDWKTWKGVLEGLSYPFVFYLGFLHKFDFIKIIKSF